MNIDLVNREFYDFYADHFDKIPFEEVLIPLLAKYLPSTPFQILEIGSGAGALALWMSKLGHRVTCIEPAGKPAEIARSKSLTVHVTRFQDYEINQKFDAVIAISSLIHIPRAEIPLAIQKIAQLVKQGGIVVLSFIEGNGEGYEDPTNKGKKRFFSKFTQVELDALLAESFSTIENCRIEVKKMQQTFVLFVLKAL